jgi:hypothetical protein
MAQPKMGESLEEFAAQYPDSRRGGWAERTLPPEIQEEIKRAYANRKAGPAAIVAWLKKKGYEDANVNKLYTLLNVK